MQSNWAVSDGELPAGLAIDPNAGTISGTPETLGRHSFRVRVEAAGRLILIDVKLSATPRPALAHSIGLFQKDLGRGANSGYVVHPGDVTLPLGPGTTAIPFAVL